MSINVQAEMDHTTAARLLYIERRITHQQKRAAFMWHGNWGGVTPSPATIAAEYAGGRASLFALIDYKAGRR